MIANTQMLPQFSLLQKIAEALPAEIWYTMRKKGILFKMRTVQLRGLANLLIINMSGIICRQNQQLQFIPVDFIDTYRVEG